MRISSKISNYVTQYPATSLNVSVFIILFVVLLPANTGIIWSFPLFLVLAPFMPEAPVEPYLIPFGIMFVFAVHFSGLYLAYLVGHFIDRKRKDKLGSPLKYWWTPAIWLSILLAIEWSAWFVVNQVLGIPIGV